MKNVIIFILFLCFQFLGGYGPAYAGTFNQKTACSPADNVKKNFQVQGANSTKGYREITDARLGEERNSPLFGEYEDEDEEDSTTRKYTFPAKCFSTYSYAFPSCRLCDCHVDRISLYNPPSYSGACKYIAQRVIRI